MSLFGLVQQSKTEAKIHVYTIKLQLRDSRKEGYPTSPSLCAGIKNKTKTKKTHKKPTTTTAATRER